MTKEVILSVLLLIGAVLMGYHLVVLGPNEPGRVLFLFILDLVMLIIILSLVRIGLFNKRRRNDNDDE